MSDNVVKLERKPEYLFSIAVYRQADGTMRGALADSARRWVESTPDARTGLFEAISLTEFALEAMKREADLIGVVEP